MSQFDVAAALYREDPNPVYYLDHDPTQAAQWACDHHVVTGVRSAVQLLSHAWAQQNPEFLPIVQTSAYEGLFARRTPPPRFGQRKVQAGRPDTFYEEFTGDPPYHLLMGQRIDYGNFRFFSTKHTNAEWVRGNTEAYEWVRAWGLALADEHKLRYSRAHRWLPKLWTLEACPPWLPTEELTAPEPVMGEEFKLIDSAGCYNTPDSYKLYYVRAAFPLLKWTNRAAPPWLESLTQRST